MVILKKSNHIYTSTKHNHFLFIFMFTFLNLFSSSAKTILAVNPMLRLQVFDHECQQSLIVLRSSEPKFREVSMGFSKQRFESEVCREVVILNKEQTKKIATI